ncbi:MAG: response regulator [Chloroflexales bacterium]|nr:response regulator [Chloroflexales bacterium]
MEEILIIDDSPQICALLAEYVLPELGYKAAIANTGRQGLARLRQALPDLILLDLQLPDISGLDLLRLVAQEGYDVPVILMTAHGSEGVAVEAFRLGARNYLIKPFSEVEARTVIDQALRERRLQREKDRLTRNLQQRVQELTVLYSIGKSVNTLMDHEELLERIVEAGVYITRAEEGFLLLRDARSDELYLRAAKNMGEQRAQRLRMPIDDSLAGQVVRTGKPVRLDKLTAGTALKVKTGFLVRSIIQVPLMVGTTVIGVLAVDNQQADRAFTENDQYLLSALADYAAIAIENARLYQQVKQSEERYKDLFTNAYDLIFTLDPQLCIGSINKAGQRLTGYSLDELRGRSLQSLCAEEAWLQVQPLLAGLLDGQQAAPFELELERRNGDALYLEVSARLTREGASSGLHCIARNLTDRRQLEQQLIQAEKLSAIGQLVAGVAHELNNPLTSVSGYAQLLLREPELADQVRQDIQHIYAQSERAARIVQNLLIFAREHKPERSVVNLNDVLKSTLSLRAYQLRVDNIVVDLQLDAKLPHTVADPYQVQQVLLNLINNAHQAMVEKGGPGTLMLRTRRAIARRDAADEVPSVVVGALSNGSADTVRTTSAPQDVLLLEVGDTGVGIPERDLNRIFDPFFTTKPVGQGTGLGLSICFGIVQEHGGRIWAASALGEGTTVTVELPLRADLIGENGPAAAPAALLPPSRAYNVLVVDDEEPVGELLARLLRDLGHHPTVATNGEDALERLGEASFDLILSDVKMPGMSGFDLHRAVQQRFPDLAPRVVFVTGDILSPATQARIAQLGNPYIAKPFAIERLQTLVRTLLEAGQEVAP